MEIHNTKVCAFYKSHPELDIENMNVWLVDILEKLQVDASQSIQSTLQGQVLECVREQLFSVREVLIRLGNLREQLVGNMHNLHKDYADQVVDKVRAHQEQAREVARVEQVELTNKLVLATREAAEHRDDERLRLTIQDTLDQLMRSTSATTNPKLDGLALSLKEIGSTLEAKSSSTLQTMVAMLGNADERAQSQITTQKRVLENLDEFLNRYRSSSSKGQIGEVHLEHVLNELFPSAEVRTLTSTTASCDFMLQRKGKPLVLIENKDYTTNARPEEVAKFVRDIETQKGAHGIFLSQRSGITSKEDFQIDLHDGAVMVFVHNTEYSPEKIRLAISLVDVLVPKLAQVAEMDVCSNDPLSSKTESVVLSRTLLSEIFEETREFAKQKETVINMHRQQSKQLSSAIEAFSLTRLESWLKTHFSLTHQTGFICDICNAFEVSTRRGLATHRRVCGEKRKLPPSSDDILGTD